jgi:putative membrane protein
MRSRPAHKHIHRRMNQKPLTCASAGAPVCGADTAAPPDCLATPDWRLPGSLLAIYGVLWSVLAIAPTSRADWLLENLLPVVAVPALVATRGRLRFSDTSYLCLFAFLSLHAVGAHYTYSLVPYDRWWQALGGTTLSEMLGWERNHYDRLVHFAYGALMLPPAVDLLERYAPPRSGWRWLMPVFFLMSHSVIYELIEWIAALVVAPELGDAYLGTQGDAWDAQKDMALAAAGSVIAMLVLRLRVTAGVGARSGADHS